MSYFSHLHNHTEFSMLDGLGSIPEFAAQAKKNGDEHLGITDHGTLCGLPQFYEECRRVEVEPILGCEFYFVDDIARVKEEKDAERYHVVFLARGLEGYKALCELSSESHRSYYYKPLIDRKMLEELGRPDDFVVLSGCAGSIISQRILEGNMEQARAEVMWWREAFPNFYIELQNHNTEFDEELNAGLYSLARRYKLPWVITNDPHYVVPEDAEHHELLLAVQTNADIDDENRFKFDGHGYWLKSSSEMRRTWRNYDTKMVKRGFRNTHKIAEMCHIRVPEWESRTWQIPNFPDVKDSFAELKRMTIEGLRERGLNRDREYIDRVKHELKVIKQTKLADFMLITADSIRHAREQGIPVGPGRGSVCGTLVGFLIGIHKIDPIKYNLLFERFLNPARPKMPDIDTDFGVSRRAEMFDYVEEKYGKENTVHVAAYQRMKMRRTFQSVAGVHGIGFKERTEISKTLTDDDDIEDVLPPEILANYPEMAAQLERLAGAKSSVSAHPAGVIIASPESNIRQLVPEMWIASSKRFIGQYDLEAVESMGLLKQDFLGLRNLDTIDECIKLIEQHTGERIDPDSWVPDEEEHDKAIYRMLAKGDTAGVFQMEGPVNQRGCREVKPQNFEDLVSVTSLYRTGPIKAGYPAVFNSNRKRSRDEIEYYDHRLEPILRETWGVILYQEQVMQIASDLAGFDMVQVDDIKEAIKHKKSALMVEMEPLFIEGCVKNGISETAASLIWKDIEGYSGYSYNRSHAVAYTFVTYQTARLKYLYPLFYFTALLRTIPQNKSGKEKRTTYLRGALEQGFKVLPPDINISDGEASPDPEKGAIRFGLRDIAGVGAKAVEKILEARPEGGFVEPEEVAEAVNNKGTFRVLCESTTLDSIGAQGTMDDAERLLGWTFRDRMKKYRKKYKNKVTLPEYDKQQVRVLGELFKVTKAHTKGGKPYMTWKIRWSLTEAYDVRLWSETSSLWNIPEGSIVMVHGEWEGLWMNIGVSDPDQVSLIKRG